MELLLVRHAIAEDREAFAATGRPDRERPLTETGIERMERAARGLAHVLPGLQTVGTSPFIRARQTAEILARAYEGADVRDVEALVPGGSRRSFLTWLTAQDQDAPVAAVGHEPDLGELAAWLVTGTDTPLFAFKKGGACLLSFDAPIAVATAELRWVLPPKMLRRLATE